MTWVRYGVVARAHGVRGEVRIAPDEPEYSLPSGIEQVRVTERDGTVKAMKVVSARSIHRAVLLTLSGVSNRDEAKSLRGAVLEIPAAVLPPTDPDNPYIFELQGATVVDDATGVALGTVAAVHDNAGQPLLCIESPEGERLLPLVETTFAGYDRAEDQLRVHVPAGLWE